MVWALVLVAASPFIAFFVLKYAILIYCEYLNLKRCKKPITLRALLREPFR